MAVVSQRWCVQVRRFPGRSHTVWLEPEGLTTSLVYPNGVSNSMEPQAQLAMLRTVCHALFFHFALHNINNTQLLLTLRFRVWKR